MYWSDTPIYALVETEPFAISSKVKKLIFQIKYNYENYSFPNERDESVCIWHIYVAILQMSKVSNKTE